MDPRTDEQVPQGAVISTEPSALPSASTCAPVTVTVSTGPAPVTVPPVAGSREADARTAIEGEGLTVGTVTPEASCEVADSVVIRSDPAGGTQVERGSAVGLVVSSGEPQATVPSVAGASEGTAVATLRNAGFDVRVVYEVSQEVSDGLVIRSDPAEQTSASTCRPVTLIVSDSVTVPDVVDMTASDATTALESLGLVVEVSSECDDGLVSSTDPVSGTRVAPGSTVTLELCGYAGPGDEEPR